MQVLGMLMNDDDEEGDESSPSDHAIPGGT